MYGVDIIRKGMNHICLKLTALILGGLKIMSEKRLINFRSISIIEFWIAFICYHYFQSIEWLFFSIFMCGVIASNLVWGLSVDE